MENAWQMKCAPTLLSSSSSSSVAPSVQVQRQDSRNQMEMNLGYYMHDQDVWRARSVTPAMTQTANYSDLSNLVSYSSGPTGIETSFHAQPSLPIQCNKKHLSDTVLFSGRNHPSYQGSAILYANTSKDMKDPSLLETGNRGRSPGAEMQSFFPSRALAGANNTTGIAVGDDLNAARAFITNPGSQSNARNDSENGGCLGPVRASYYRTSHGTDNCTLHKVHSKVASNVSCRPSTVINGTPRVFCMNKCGNLLLSNMGLLGIVCSCHGQNMSIAKFCEHSGISDVNPGDAVRMDSGESIAQWRSLYFQKFGIRAKEDDRGWDWPEEFTTAGATKCSTGVTAGTYDSVLSDIHLVASKNLLDNVSGRISHSGRNYTNKVQNDQLAKGLDQKAPSHRGLNISSNSNASAVVNVQPCNFPGHLTVSRANDPGLSCWPRLSSVGRSAVSTTVSSSLSTFEKLGNLGSEIQNHCKDNNFLDRGTLSSSIELKLGQPSQQASGSTSLPLFGCQITDLQNILSSELLNRNHRPEFISKYIECSGQYNLCNTASYSSSSRRQCHFGPADHARKIGSENDVNNLECLKDKSIKSSMISKPHSCTVLKESVQHKEINKPVNDVNQPIPWILHSHSHMGKSEPSVIPARQASQGNVPQIPQINGCDGTVRPPGTAKREVQKNAAGTVEAWKGCKDSSSRTESSFQIYAKQMENSGFFTRSMSDTFYPRGPVSHGKKFNSFQLSSLPLDNFRNYTVLGCDSPISSSTCYGHGKMTSAQASTLGSFSEAAASTAVSKQNLVQVNKDGAGRPHLLSESLRMIASKKRSDSCKIGDVDASFGLHQQPTILSSLPELRMKRSPPDVLIQEGQMSGLDFTTPCNVSEHVAASVLPGAAPRMGVDREKLVMLVGSNNPEDAAICARGIPSHAEERDTIHQGSVAPVPIKHSSMGIGSKMTSSEVYNQYYQEGSDRFMSGRGNLVGSSRCLYIQNDSLVSPVNGSVQKVNFYGDNASNSCTPRFDKDPVPVECKGKMHDQITENLNFQCPEWRKVSPKANGFCKLSDDTNLTARSDKSGEGETHTEPSAICIYDQVTGSNEGKGESDLSSGCSGAAVSELSDGMNKIDSCTVHDADIGNADDQVVDQPCLIDKSCSSDDDLKSQESADFPSSTAFTKEKHLKLLPISTSHNFADHLEQKDTARLERTNSQSHCLEAHDKFAKFTKFANGLKSGKKKHRRKWMSLGASFATSNTSLSHSTSPSHSGKAVDQQHCNSKAVSTLFLPDQSSSHMHGDYSTNGSCKRKRSALPLSRKLPRRRDLQKIYDTAKSGHYRQKLEGNATFVDTSEVTTAKRLKQNKLPEVPLQKPYCQAAEGNLQHSLVECMKPCRSSKTSVLKKMTKPIVCGMYGIISGQDGLMKCPRIVPLSQVLEKAENCSEIENHDSKAILMRELRDGFSGWKRKPSRDFAMPSIEEKYLEDLTKRNNNTCYSEDDKSSDEEFTLDKEVANRCKRNMGNSRSCRTISLNSKGRKVRKRSLYEFQGVGDKMIGLNARNMLHATDQTCDSKIYFADSANEEQECTCARTEGYKGRKQDREKFYSAFPAKGREKCLVSEEQLNAWFYISRKKWRMKGQLKPSGSLKSSGSYVEQDCKKEYAQFKQAKHWKHLMVYKSRIHALGLYTSVFISRGTMVVEYIGEIVGPRIADKRENDYLSGRGVQYKSACYFFRIDKEHIIDATRKGGIARFVNHSCRPNCVAKIITVKNEKKVVFFAERDIYPGEEITYDYHFNNEDEGKKITCFCRSSNCRRYLN